MRPDSNVLDVKSTLQGEKVMMSLDPEAAAHLMGVLTNLYSDQEMAVIREYSTNALDSQIEAGVNRPIEVSTPSTLSPYFRVKDYGLGLDAEDIRNIYSRYGASSKRESDQVVGMLGLGCKSALTYTDQFTVTGVKNGRCVQVSVSKNSDGGGSMTIVSDEPTDEPNGVEIVVPVKVHNSFDTKAKRFFRYWKPGTILLNGQEPARIEGIQLSNNLILEKSFGDWRTEHTRAGSVIVMGNVPYPVTDNSFPSFSGGFDNKSGYYLKYHLVAFVDIGEINFVPSRESLHMTLKTKETIGKCSAEAKKLLEGVLKDRISSAKTGFEAISNYFEARKMVSNIPFKWKGKALPGSIVSNADCQILIAAQGKKGYSKSYSKERSVPIETWHKSVFIVGYDRDDLTPYRRKKLDIWQAKEGVSTETYIFVKEFPKELVGWTDPDKKTYDWAEINAIKIEKKTGTNNNGQLLGAYGVMTKDGTTTISADKIDTSKPLFYDHYIYSEGYPAGVQTFHKDLLGDGCLILLPLNRIEKFKRDFPVAKNWDDVVRERGENWAKNLSQTAKFHLVARRNLTGICEYLVHTKINDPNLADLVKGITSKVVSDDDQYARVYGYLMDVKEIKKDLEDILNRYPLLRHLDYSAILDDKSKTHVYEYINAIAKRRTTNAV